MGNRNGHAQVSFENGDAYQGEWKNGKRHGDGKYIYANGDRYEGEYHENKRHGRGTFVFADGSQYVGEYRADKKHGLGTYTYPNGAVYEGVWKDGLKDGLGTHIFASGARYDGMYRKDLMEGDGTYTFEDGEWYSGNWKKGKMHGSGKLKQKGEIWMVKYAAGALVSKEPIPRGGEADAAKREAEHSVLASGTFASLSTAQEGALQMVEVTICKGRELGRTDFMGLSDPYAVLSVEEVREEEPGLRTPPDWTGSKVAQRKTKTCRKTLDPVWDSSFSFVIRCDRKYKFSLNVWDWDMGKSDDLLGDTSFVLNADQLDNQVKWFPLSNTPRPYLKNKAQSDLTTRIQEQQPLLSEDNEFNRSSSFTGRKTVTTSMDMRRSSTSAAESSGVNSKTKPQNSMGGLSNMLSPRRMFGGYSAGASNHILPAEVAIRCRLVPFAHWEVTVVQARNIPKLDVFGKADPYCVLMCLGNDDGEWHGEEDMHWTGGHANGFKTSTKRNTLAPVWNDSFFVPIRGRPTGRELLKIQLWDWDMGKTDDFVGLVQVPLTEDLRVDVHRNSISGVTAWYKCTDNDGKKVSAWNSGKRPAKSSEGVEVEPEIQIRLRIVKKGTLEQFLVGDKAKSLREASLKVSESFELWELEDMCKVWYHTNPSGLVDRERFNSFATDFLKLPPGAEEHIDRMFGLIDENKDGVLSFAELSLALATLARGTSEEKLELGFRLNDLNGDGFISGEEVWKAVHVLWLSGGVKDIDAIPSADGNELVQQFLRVADTDGDQRISMDEYKAVALSDERFLARMRRDSAIVEFNRDPHRNLPALLDECKLTHSPEDVATCLGEYEHIARLSRGDLLGFESIDGFDLDAVRRVFMQRLGLEGSTIDGGLRRMLETVHPPDDIEGMERVFRAYADAYAQANPRVSGDGGAIYGTVLSIIRLNVNVHGAGDVPKMSPQEFLLEVRGTFSCGSIDTEVLDRIYQGVCGQEIAMGLASVGEMVIQKLIDTAMLR